MLVFFLAPVVPYMNSVSVPGAGQVRSTDVWGLATPSYAVIGYGSPPYSPTEVVSSGNHSALVFFSGGKAVAVEDAGPPGVVLNPSSVIAIMYAGVSSSDWGWLNITMQLRNIGFHNISSPVVYVSMVGFSSNGTSGALTVVQPKPIGTCGSLWLASAYCQVSQVTPNNLPVNKSFTYYAEIRGTVEGTPFVYRVPFGEYYPRGGVGPIWVNTFITNVNLARGGPPLRENSTLDAFAALRFKDASARYQISDYNFTVDAESFFGPDASQNVGEMLLFPGIFSPNTYPGFLAEYAVGHWDGLMDTQYTQFGYYVAQGTYYNVSIPCPVYEIPGAGVNITQYFQQHGCITMVATTTWLVIILGA